MSGRFDDELTDLINAAHGRTLRELRVAFPAVVTRYDASLQVVDVQPQVADWFPGEGDAIEQVFLPILTNVPVLFPGSGGFRVTFPVAVGDEVEILVQDRSIDAWQAHGGRQAPADRRRHNLADAVAIPGLHNNAKAWTGASLSAMTLGKDGGPQAAFTASQIQLGGSGDAVALASKVNALITQLKTLFGSGWTVVPSDGGAALKAAFAAMVAAHAADWATPSVGSSVVKVAP